MMIKALVAIAAAFVFAALPVGGARAGALFALVDTGELFRSADGGANWSLLSTLPVPDAIAIAAGESSDELFLATESGGIYRSTDGGVTFTAMGTVAASDIVDMVIRTDGAIFLTSATGSVYRSLDDGATFAAIATITASNIVSIDGDEGGGNLYALAETGEVWKSTGGGFVWSAVAAITIPNAVEIQSVGVDLYVLTGTGEVVESTDQAATWLTVGAISQLNMRGLTVDGSTLVAATVEGLIAASGDASNWTFTGSVNQLHVVDIGNDTPQATGIGDGPPEAASALKLRNVWPNPSRSTEAVSLTLELPRSDVVSLTLFDVRGRPIAARAPERLPAGRTTLTWNPPFAASGIYFLAARTTTGRTAHTKLAVVR